MIQTAPLHNSAAAPIQPKPVGKSIGFSIGLGILTVILPALCVVVVYNGMVTEHPIMAAAVISVIALLYAAVYWLRISVDHFNKWLVMLALSALTLGADMGVILMANIKEEEVVQANNQSGSLDLEIEASKAHMETDIGALNSVIDAAKANISQLKTTCSPVQPSLVGATERELMRYQRSAQAFERDLSALKTAIDQLKKVTFQDSGVYPLGTFAAQAIDVTQIKNSCLTEFAVKANADIALLMPSLDKRATEIATQTLERKKSDKTAKSFLTVLYENAGKTIKKSWAIMLFILAMAFLASYVVKPMVVKRRRYRLALDPKHSIMLKALHGQMNSCTCFSFDFIGPEIYLQFDPNESMESQTIYQLAIDEEFGRGCFVELAFPTVVAELNGYLPNPSAHPNRRWFQLKSSVLQEFYGTSLAKPKG